LDGWGSRPRGTEKGYLLKVANRLAILAMIFLSLGFVGILILLSDVVLGGAGPLIAEILATAGIGGLWFVLPLARRSEEPDESRAGAGVTDQAREPAGSRN
jgi:Family of unknown function (DUF6328)